MLNSVAVVWHRVAAGYRVYFVSGLSPRAGMGLAGLVCETLTIVSMSPTQWSDRALLHHLIFVISRSLPNLFCLARPYGVDFTLLIEIHCLLCIFGSYFSVLLNV